MISKPQVISGLLVTFGLGISASIGSAQADEPTIITVDAASNRHPISPLIYGVAFASTEQLKALNSPLNRSGGNGTTRYNWKDNSSNHAADWFFESIAEKSAVPGEASDSFIAGTRAAGAQSMMTIPMIGWVAKIGPERQILFSYSVAKYGAQEKVDSYRNDAGNGVKPDGKTKITNNDPNDANMPANPEFQKGWVQHLVSKWGKADKGGVPYYIMDNEASLWHETHRDVHPQGETMDEILGDVIAYGSMVKSVDPKAKVVAGEEWGWPGYFYSGADTKYRGEHHYSGSPDRDAHGGMEFTPWLLDQLHTHDKKTGKRLLDVFTVHIYPQGGEALNENITPEMQAKRNRSTRALWDPNYLDESWINDKVMLIPRLKAWVSKYYPGTKIGITEYNWGAEKSINGATTQADIFGIFGREGLDLATRWTTPDLGTPTFKSMQMYRNYDGHNATFGDLSVSDQTQNPDLLSSFAAIRSSDHALTVMVINKSLDKPTPISLALANFKNAGKAQVWQLTSTNTITLLDSIALSDHRIQTTVPSQSITLFVVTLRSKLGKSPRKRGGTRDLTHTFEPTQPTQRPMAHQIIVQRFGGG